MSPVIRVDDQVWQNLQSQATPFEDTPNSVLRRLLGLDPVKPKTTRGTAHEAPPSPTVASPSLAPAVLLTSGHDYEVTKGADTSPRWWFQIYKSKLERTAARGGRVVVICDKGSPTQITFAISCSYLMNVVLPNARLEPNGRYMFTVKKDTLEFVFQGGSRFDGKQFLISSEGTA